MMQEKQLQLGIKIVNITNRKRQEDEKYFHSYYDKTMINLTL